MNSRRLALFGGVAALALGLAAIASPGLVAISLDRIIVWGIGLVALLQAFRVVQARRHGELDEAATPDPELPVATAPPGEDIEAVIEDFLDARAAYFYRSPIREGLRSVAIAVLTQYGPYSEAEAKAAVEAGTWTDDRSAAAFIGDETAPPLPLGTRVRNWFRREPPLERWIRHTVDAIVEATGVTPRSNGRSTRPTGRPAGRRARGGGTDAAPTRFGDPGTDGPEGEETDAVARAAHPTGHWQGVSVVALVGIGVGVLVGEPAVLLAGVVGIGFAAYARSSVLPPGRVSIDRTVDADRPEPGDDIEVTVTVTNETGGFLPDVRLVDGVPGALTVVDGSARHGTALRSGESDTFSYTLMARRGVHHFDPALLVARDLAGSTEQERVVTAETTTTCLPTLQPLSEPIPLREPATPYVGEVETTSGGPGLEFYATREYRHGDPMNRIDWNRRARTGEFTTIEFLEEHAATVLVVIDARDAAYVSSEPYEPHALDRSVDAAGQLYATLTDSGDRVGIAALGPEECWLEPGIGVDHAVEARRLLATHPAFTPVLAEERPTTFGLERRLRKRLSTGTQIVFLTTLCDEYGGRFARRLDEYGYPVTIISPDPTADRTPGHRLSRVARTLRMSTIRSAGVPVVDWRPDEPVERALARYDDRWSQ